MPSISEESDRPLANGVNEVETSAEPKKALCATCLKLNLSADKFIIDNGSQSSAKIEHNRFLPQLESLSMSDISLKSRSTRKLLGSLADIQRRSKSCPFCSLVIQSALPADTSRTYDNAKCYANWELDGCGAPHDQGGRVSGRTRRIHLIWDDESLEDSYLVFVAPERYLRPNSDARRVWGNEALFLGRTIDTEMGNQALIKSWLDLCRKTHQGPCRDDTTTELSVEFGDIISQSYFGVIDVLDMQLTSLPFETHENVMAGGLHYHDNELGLQIGGSKSTNRRIKHEPYIALSYVWGKGEPYMTKLSNVMLHRLHGGFERNLEELPRVFHDAFNLVRCLGVRYIWIRFASSKTAAAPGALTHVPWI